MKIARSAAGLLLALFLVCPFAYSQDWSGSVRCELSVTATGYTHQETQTWTLTGAAPTRQGSFNVYPATWGVTGQGTHDRARGPTRRVAQWAAGVQGMNAPVALHVTPGGQLVAQLWHAQLTSPGGYTGTDQYINDGVPQAQTRLVGTVYEWQAQKIEASPRDTQISRSTTMEVKAQLGPMQPPDAQSMVTCAWSLGRGTTPPAPLPPSGFAGPPSSPPATGSPPVASTPPPTGPGTSTGSGSSTPPVAPPASTARPSIQVAPITGTWVRGQNHTVTWTHNVSEPDAAFNVMVHFVLEDGSMANIGYGFARSTASPVSFTGADQLHEFPSPARTGRVSVTLLTSDGRASDVRAESPEFPVAPEAPRPAPPEVRVMAPNGGERLVAGSFDRFEVSWTHNYPEGQSFDVDFSVDGGANWSRYASAESRTSTIVRPRDFLELRPTNAALVRVSPSGNAAAGDVSDGPFTVVAPVPASDPAAVQRYLSRDANMTAAAPMTEVIEVVPTDPISDQWWQVDALDNGASPNATLQFRAAITGGAADRRYDLDIIEVTNSGLINRSLSGTSAAPGSGLTWPNRPGVDDGKTFNIRVRHSQGAPTAQPYRLTLSWGGAPVQPLVNAAPRP